MRTKASPGNIWFEQLRDLLVDTYEEWRQDRTLRLGAGLAYYAMFTVVPFLALLAALAGQLFDAAAFERFLADRAGQLGIAVSADAGTTIAAELDRFSSNTLYGVIGLATLLFSSSLVFLALVDAVNAIWHVPVRSGVRRSVRRRLFSFLMVLVTISVIVAALVLHAVSGAAENLLPNDVLLLDTMATVLSSLVSAAALGVVVMLLYRYVGPTRVGWRSAVLAAVITTVFLILGTAAIGWYLRRFGGASLGGAFGAVLLVLTWVYYEAQILLAGVQLTKVLVRRDVGARFATDDAASPNGSSSRRTLTDTDIEEEFQ